MSLPASLDPDLLRTFVFIAEDGSFTRAAARVGRTQSAVSMQVQRLETVLGQRLLARGKGGTVQLTPHGQFLLARAKEMLALNDGIMTSFRSPAVQGTVRLGTPDDYALRYVPQVLRRFAENHPSVQVDVLCLPSHLLIQRLRAGELDLALCSEGHEPAGWPVTTLWRGPLSWVTSDKYTPHRQDPLPVAFAVGEHCTWSTVARRALEEAGRAYRVAYSAGTLMGSMAPVIAGLAVTVSTTSWLPDGLRPVRPGEGLPPLPSSAIFMTKAPDARQPVTDVLARYMADTFRADDYRGDEGRELAA